MRKDSEYLRTTFNSSAGWYDRIRPGYPERLIDDVISLSAIPPRGQILEIGCGTGKATEMFASRGYAMLCLEIGIDLAAVALQKFRASANVQIVVSSFEEWEPGNRLFDLIIAATSFHWVNRCWLSSALSGRLLVETSLPPRPRFHLGTLPQSAVRIGARCGMRGAARDRICRSR